MFAPGSYFWARISIRRTLEHSPRLSSARRLIPRSTGSSPDPMSTAEFPPLEPPMYVSQPPRQRHLIERLPVKIVCWTSGQTKRDRRPTINPLQELETHGQTMIVPGTFPSVPTQIQSYVFYYAMLIFRVNATARIMPPATLKRI